MSSDLTKAMGDNVARQMALTEQLQSAGALTAAFGDAWQGVFAEESAETAPAARQDVFMDRAACLAFGVGKIAPVLGEAFAEVDTYPTRVRLPAEPLMLVDRIVQLINVFCLCF